MKRHQSQSMMSAAAIAAACVLCVAGCSQSPEPENDELTSQEQSLAVPVEATAGDIHDSGWVFEDADTVAWAQAGRSAAAICSKRGFAGGFFSGAETQDRKGLVCVGGGAQLVDATAGELLDSGWTFEDTNLVGWAQAGRAAARICSKRGFVGGFFTGNQTPETGRKALICVNEGARWFSATAGEILDSGSPFDDTNTIGWATASRAAASICSKHGFLGGWFNGGQTFGRKSMVCVR